jgi:hypothetical protein
MNLSKGKLKDDEKNQFPSAPSSYMAESVGAVFPPPKSKDFTYIF